MVGWLGFEHSIDWGVPGITSLKSIVGKANTLGYRIFIVITEVLQDKPYRKFEHMAFQLSRRCITLLYKLNLLKLDKSRYIHKSDENFQQYNTNT